MLINATTPCKCEIIVGGGGIVGGLHNDVKKNTKQILIFALTHAQMHTQI